jgi:hypothetical protein
VLKSLLPGGTADAQLASWIAAESIDVQLVAKEGAAELCKLVASRLGITLEGDDLSKWRRIVARTALGLEFRSDLGGFPPAALAALPTSTAEIDRNARAVCAALRANHPDAYPALADRAESELKLHAGSIDPLALGSIDTFRFEEGALLTHCSALVAGKRFHDALQLVEQREHSFWLDRDVGRKAQWEACRRMAELGTEANAVKAAVAKAGGDVNAWVGVRCASGDRRPLVGPLTEEANGLWACTALGSRGLSFAALCAELLAAQWHGEPLPLPAALAKALGTQRL